MRLIPEIDGTIEPDDMTFALAAPFALALGTRTPRIPTGTYDTRARISGALTTLSRIRGTFDTKSRVDGTAEIGNP